MQDQIFTGISSREFSGNHGKRVGCSGLVMLPMSKHVTNKLNAVNSESR